MCRLTKLRIIFLNKMVIIAMVIGGVSTISVANANSVNIAGTGNNSNVSLNAAGGSTAPTDIVSTAQGTSGTFNLNIDSRPEVLNTMTIGNNNLANDLAVTLKQGSGNITEITSGNLNIVASEETGETTIYTISTDLTQKVNGKVSIQGDDGVARLNVDGTLIVNNDTTSIQGVYGMTTNSQLNVSGKIIATNGNDKNNLTLNYLDITLNSALLDTSSLSVLSSNLNILGNTAISNITYENNLSAMLNEGTLNLSGVNKIEELEGNGNINIKAGTSTIDSLKQNNLDINENAKLVINENNVNITNDINIDGTMEISVAGVGVGSSNYTGAKINANKVFFGDNSNLVLVVDDLTSFVKGDKTGDLQIITATSSFGDATNTNFSNLSINNARFDVAAGTASGSYNITYLRDASEVAIYAGGSANNAQTAEAWDKAIPSTASQNVKDVASKLNTLSQTSPKTYIEALTALAPETASATTSNIADNTKQIFNAVSNRFTSGSITPQSEDSDNFNQDGTAVWIQGLLNTSELNNDNGFDTNSEGIAFGFEKEINEDIKTGIAYAYTNSDISATSRNTDVDTNTAIIYGEYKPNNWFVNGIATYSFGSYEENKNVSGININANYDVDSIGLQTMSGYDFATYNNTTITPEGGLRYIRMKQNSYTDTAGQSVNNKTDNVLTAVAGVKASKDFILENGMILRPEIKGALTYDLIEADSSSLITLLNGSTYSIKNESLNRFGQEVGIGIIVDINDSIQAILSYEGKFKQDYLDHSGIMNIKYNF